MRGQINHHRGGDLQNVWYEKKGVCLESIWGVVWHLLMSVWELWQLQDIACVTSDLIGSDFRLLEGPDWWSTTAERRSNCRERNLPQAATEAEFISHAYQWTGSLCHHDFTPEIFTLKHTQKKTRLFQRITPVLGFWMTYFCYSFLFHYFYFNRKEQS